jgi:hypothetical protein
MPALQADGFDIAEDFFGCGIAAAAGTGFEVDHLSCAPF